MIEEDRRNKYLKLMAQGARGFVQMEEEIYERRRQEAALEIQERVNEFTHHTIGHQLAKQIGKQNGYNVLRRKSLRVKLQGGEEVSMFTWYSTQSKKKRGRKKKGPNGQGAHMLLKYWGFFNKHSPGYISRVIRSGISAMSYEIAAKDLQAQGYRLVGKSIDNAVQSIGKIALKHRSDLMIKTGEDWKGKRIMIAIDGGRVRTRETKRGRYAKKQKRAGYATNWREPKMVVVAELDKNGRKKKGTAPLYEATMGDADAVFALLKSLTEKCRLDQATEIILTGDGAEWIWERYRAWQKQYGVEHKTTEILDWYHAVEHLHDVCEAHIKLTEDEKQEWFQKLKQVLAERDYPALQQEVNTQIDVYDQVKEQEVRKKLKQTFSYFTTHQTRIAYHHYAAVKQPKGSGIIESAIRRVINLKLKSPGIFWKLDNLERVLHLRCILLADRWHVFMRNLVQVNCLTLNTT
jgi:hypothetical protein